MGQRGYPPRSPIKNRALICFTIILWAGKGDIFLLKSHHDYDDKNDGLARAEKISGRIMNYEIRENWGRIDTGIYSKGGK